MTEPYLFDFTPAEKAQMIATRPPLSLIRGNETPHRHTRAIVAVLALALLAIGSGIILSPVPLPLFFGAAAIAGYFVYDRQMRLRAVEEVLVEQAWARRVQQAAAILTGTPEAALDSAFSLPPLRDHEGGDGGTFTFRLAPGDADQALVMVDLSGEVTILTLAPEPVTPAAPDAVNAPEPQLAPWPLVTLPVLPPAISRLPSAA